MKKKKRKLLAKDIIRQMARGRFLESVAGTNNITIAKLEKLINKYKDLADAHELGHTKLRSFYQQKLVKAIDDRWANKDAIRIFYSHFLDVYEKKQTESMSDDSVEHTTEFE